MTSGSTEDADQPAPHARKARARRVRDEGSAPRGLVPAGNAASRRVARRSQERPVIVLVGMHCSGASVLARMLQLLGVDMAETGAAPVGDRRDWERPEIVAFNDRLLDLIGRPLDSPAHALPFPPGWWGEPRVLALKREVQAYLRDALDDRYGLWGFKDLRVTRLLPFWQQVFDEMGLRPLYLWTIRDPAQCAADAVARGLAMDAQIGEAMWFVYNADAHKYLGDDAVAIVDHHAWLSEPEQMVERLLRALPLTWRGSRAELLECLGSFAAEPRNPASRVPSPLVHAFYEAIRAPEPSETSLRTRHTVAQAVDILRTLISPYAKLLGSGASPDAATGGPSLPPGRAHADARATEDPARQDALAEATARAEQAEALTRATEDAMNREIEARTSENVWLQQRHSQQKDALSALEEELHAVQVATEAETRRLRGELETCGGETRAAQRKAKELHDAAERARKLAKEELDQLRKELSLQKAANERYLSRIYELKAVRKTADPPGNDPTAAG